MGSVLDRVGVGRERAGEFDLLAPDAQRGQVRWLRLVVAVMVLAGSALAGWLVLASQSAEVEVWVARSRIAAGETLSERDVLLQRVDADSTLSALEASTPVVGRRARISIPAGSPVMSGHLFAEGDVFAAGDGAEMSVLFEVGTVTDSVERNDLVRIVVVPDEDGEALAVFESVPVSRVDREAQRSSSVMVSLELSVAESDRLVEALAGADSWWATVVGRR